MSSIAASTAVKRLQDAAKAKAAENAVAQAAKTVRGLKWGRVCEFEIEIDDGKKITEYRATTKLYFDIER